MVLNLTNWLSLSPLRVLHVWYVYLGYLLVCNGLDYFVQETPTSPSRISLVCWLGRGAGSNTNQIVGVVNLDQSCEGTVRQCLVSWEQRGIYGVTFWPKPKTASYAMAPHDDNWRMRKVRRRDTAKHSGQVHLPAERNVPPCRGGNLSGNVQGDMWS